MKLSLTTYIGLTVVVICQAVMYIAFQISFAGYWTDKLLVWAWLALTPFVVVPRFKHRLAKVYSALLVAILILSMIPFFLPLFAFLTFVTANDRPFYATVSSEYRIQEVSRSPMVGRTLEVVKKSGLIEQTWNLGPSHADFGDSIYRFPNGVSLSISNTGIKTAFVQLPDKKVKITIP